MLRCEFEGFIPDDFLELYADAMLRRVTELAPYESNLVFRVERIGERFRARIEIEALSGPLRAEAVARDPKLAIDLVEEELDRVLAQWRRGRFSEAS